MLMPQKSMNNDKAKEPKDDPQFTANTSPDADDCLVGEGVVTTVTTPPPFPPAEVAGLEVFDA